MWIILGGRTRVRRIPDGRVVRRRCQDCEAVTDWVECDMFDRVEVFFVSLLDTKSRRFVCLECGDDVHPDDVGPPPSKRAPARTEPGPPSSSPSSSRASLPRSSRDVATISAGRVGPHHPEIDEELAALKRRLGK